MLYNLPLYFFFTASHSLSSQPGIEPKPLTLGVWSLNQWNIRKVPYSFFFFLEHSKINSRHCSILPVNTSLCVYVYESESEVAQSCSTLCDPMDCSLPGSSLHGILQARVLEWGAISFSRGSSRPRDRTLVSCIPGRHFNL